MLFELHGIARVGLEPLQKIYRDYATPLLNIFASFSFLIRCLEVCVCVSFNFSLNPLIFSWFL